MRMDHCYPIVWNDDHGGWHSLISIVTIRKSEPFFGWIAGLGGIVRIHGPKSLKDESADYLDGLAAEARK